MVPESSYSSLESDGSDFESVGSPLPLPPLFASPLPPIPDFETKITRVSHSTCQKTEGSSLSSTTSNRPSSVERTTSSTDDTTTHVRVIFGFLDAYGRC